MSKKFLCSLIALVAFVGFGCDGDGDDSNKPDCTGTVKKCDGNKLNQCVNGEWKLISTCTEGCDGQKLACNESLAKCTSNQDCASTPATPECNTLTGKCQAASSTNEFTPTPIPEGQSSTLNDPCDDKFVSSCINGGEDMLLCWNNVITQWSCDSCIAAGYNPDKPNEAKCVRNQAQRPNDVPETCVSGTSKAICASDGRGWVCGDKNTYYTSDNLNCTADKPCVLCDNGYVGCGITCNQTVERPANVPETCASGDPGICGSDGNAWICGDKNTYYTAAKFMCTADKPCKLCKNGYVGCGVVCNEDKVDCTATSEAACNAVCSEDKKTGYYWSKDKIAVMNCENADCNVTDGRVECGVADSDCTAESTSICLGACNEAKTEGYYWSNNKVNKLTCANADCNVSNNRVECGVLEACTPQSTAKCKGACKEDKTEGYFWSSNQLKTKTCSNADCTVSDTGFVSCGPQN